MTSEWNQICLNDAVSKLGDGLHGTPKYDDNGEYFFINGNNLVDGEIAFKDSKRVSESEYEKYKKDLNDRTILVSINGTLGNIAVYKGEKCILGKSACYFNVRDEYDKDFIRYVVSTSIFQEYIRRYANGTTIKNVSLKAMREYIFLCPDLPTQHTIAATLSALDNKIAVNKAINHHLEQMAQAIFKSWFVDFEPFGGVMPNDWQVKILGDLCETVTKGTTPTTLKKKFVEQGINFVKAESILDDHSLDFDKLAFIDDETNTLLSRSIIRESDIIFTIAGTLGRFAFVHDALLPANTNQAVAIIRADTSKINPIILYSFFIGGLHSDFYSMNFQQAVQANLSLTTIKALPLILPTAKPLAEYTALVQPILERIFKNYAENRHLAALRDTLLPRLTLGEITIKEVIK